MADQDGGGAKQLTFKEKMAAKADAMKKKAMAKADQLKKKAEAKAKELKDKKAGGKGAGAGAGLAAQPIHQRVSIVVDDEVSNPMAPGTEMGTLGSKPGLSAGGGAPFAEAMDRSVQDPLHLRPRPTSSAETDPASRGSPSFLAPPDIKMPITEESLEAVDGEWQGPMASILCPLPSHDWAFSGKFFGGGVGSIQPILSTDLTNMTNENRTQRTTSEAGRAAFKTLPPHLLYDDPIGCCASPSEAAMEFFPMLFLRTTPENQLKGTGGVVFAAIPEPGKVNTGACYCCTCCVLLLFSMFTRVRLPSWKQLPGCNAPSILRICAVVRRAVG
jgi:hypothetical protein